MPDAPDFYQYRLESGKKLLGDLSELAVRVGSVVKYDRGGSVLFADSFDHGFAPFLPQLDGTGAAADIVSDPTYGGGYSARLTAGSDAGLSSGIQKRLSPPVINKIGFEFTFSLETVIDYVQMTIRHNTATKRNSWNIFWRVSDSALKYYAQTDPAQTFGTLTLPTGDKELFHTVKVVIDLETRYYSRFNVDQHQYDLSAYQGRTQDEVGDPRLELTAWVVGRSGENDIMYLDDFIVTTDEI